MPLLTTLVQDFLLQDATLLTGAASLVYTGTVAGAAVTAVFSRRTERRVAARRVLALLVRREDGENKRR
jgi:hypothetical protein